MTQEQKAKAYDEALEKAKIEINTKGIGETVDLCEQLFPQLAENDDEESEDERIRKWLYELVDEGAYLCERPFATESILAYLEKQKESLPISETCKENANSFIDGIIEVRSFQRGMEEGRRLEKQKEQNGEDKKRTDFTIYHPLKNTKGEYECIPYSFYGSLTSFSEDKDLIDFLRTCFYTKEECNEWIKQQEEQEPLPPFDEFSPEGKMNHPLYLEGFDTGRKVQKVFDEQKP